MKGDLPAPEETTVLPKADVPAKPETGAKAEAAGTSGTGAAKA